MSDRDMTYASADKQMPSCSKCGLLMVQMGSTKECPNCYYDKIPKTGQTMVVHEEAGKPTRLEFLKPGESPSPQMASQAAGSSGAAKIVATPQPGTISVHVPVELFIDLVAWSKKLKWPKRPEEAARLKAILEFQVQLNNKLQEMANRGT